MVRWSLSLALVGLWLGSAVAQEATPGSVGGFTPANMLGLPPAPPPAAPAAPSAPPAQGNARPQHLPMTGPAMPAPCLPNTGPISDEVCLDVGVCKKCGTFYADLEYIHWWVRQTDTPPLLTSGQLADPIPGAVGQPNTRFVTTNSPGPWTDFNGVRATMGYRFGEGECAAVEVSAFALEQNNDVVTLSSGGNGVLARPFFNVVAGREDADPVIVPGVLSGTISFSSLLRLWGGEANFKLFQPESALSIWRVAGLLGVRYLALDDKLIVAENLADVPGLGAAGNTYALMENFTTYNRFYGAQFGAEAVADFGAIQVQIIGKVALGNTKQNLNVSAGTRVTDATGLVTTGVGRALLVQPSNVGSASRNTFSAVPELGLNLIYDINGYIRLTVGYTLLYWSDTARPGDQIDRGINIQAVQPLDQVGVARPARLFNSSELWVQGLAVGLQFRF